MALFECEKCGCGDNTAITNAFQYKLQNKPLLCSECDPAIDGWHGRFIRRPAAEMREQNPGAWESEQ
jgi:hypothetical protein